MRSPPSSSVVPGPHAPPRSSSAAALFRIPGRTGLNGATVPELAPPRRRELFDRQPARRLPPPASAVPRAHRTGAGRRPRPPVGEHDGQASHRPVVAARRRPELPDGRASPRRRPRARRDRLLGRAVRDAVPGAPRRRRHQGRVGPASRPDAVRGPVPPTQDQWWEQATLFLSVNLDKRGITLDLSRPRAVSCSSSSSRPPTWWSRTSPPGSWSSSGSPTTSCERFAPTS